MATLPDFFPFQDRDLVRQAVTAAHGDAARVRDLVTAHPALARASWDWGFGDHETPIDAASHVGNRQIAEFLLAHGARGTIFTAAMLGQLEVVRQMVEASPGVQRARGPHGLTLLAHARAGGAAAEAVVRYLAALGDADSVYQNIPLDRNGQSTMVGEYALPSGTARLQIASDTRDGLTIAVPGLMVERMLFHQGHLVFNPAGAEAVKIRFEPSRGELTIQDGPVSVTARKVEGP